jgi:Uma2 family endonuclease
MKSTIVDFGVPSRKTANGQADGRLRSTIVLDDQVVGIPAWVRDHASFRRWLHSDEFPERTGRICYLAEEVWVDMSKEQVFSHNQAKAEFARGLGTLVKEGRRGRFFPDGVLLSNLEAELTTQPDGVFVSTKSMQAKRVRFVEGARAGFVEIEGTPDMVLEVVSDSSVTKDTEVLRELYWKAGVREYWLVDARGEQLRFEILRHGRKGYTATRPRGCWLKSIVFGKAIRLTVSADEMGNPEYTLEVK